MSELQRRWAKAKMDAMAAGSFDEEEEEEAGGGDSFDDSSSVSSSSASSTGTVVPSASQHLFARPLGPPRGGGRSLEPVPWTRYFERELFLGDEQEGDDKRAEGEEAKEETKDETENETKDESKPQKNVYHAYLTSPSGGPLFVMHHGAGSSGLSFAVVGSEIRKRLPSAGILAVDAREHGSTTTKATEGYDLRRSTLRDDLLTVIRRTQETMRWAQLPPLVLVGHSLGGAVVTDVAFSRELGSALLGYAVLDVVEGSAMDALQSMKTYLSTRPAGFASVQSGIEWHLRSRTLRNATSARTSVPPLLVETKAKTSGSEDHLRGDSKPWHWRTDLAATQPFWEDWFRGLSKMFLEAPGGKLLLLAGTDRLDTELTIGQMQGKYALQVFPEAGHFIHEDLPERTAMTLVDFYRRNDRTTLVLPPKVSELLAQGKKV